MLEALQRGWRQPGIINYLILPVSALYFLLMKARQILYAIGVFKSIRIHAPVVVVGGISVGGNGKTPVVLELISHFKTEGLNPGVVSRGYGGNSAFWPRIVDHNTSSGIVGDEPQLIFNKQNVPVMVGPDRVASACELIDKHGCNIIISDDGFAHFRLHRDLDIVVVDGHARFGNGWCLPAGPLREPVSSLQRADMVVLNGDSDNGDVSQQGWLKMQMQFTGILNLKSGKPASLEYFSEKKVNAVAGIGNPERFFSQLEINGLDIIRQPFPDHHGYTPSDLEFDNDFDVLMTEKDGIKCAQLEIPNSCWVVHADAKFEPEFYKILADKLKYSNV